ncbi:ATP-binding protein [Candidatus Absconditicoccus praedator]|uniref:ATP-binding protein n=1 Tax=Candidatus Absconditicoccus praedator TaxID=2735562 RepID=UPI001E2D94A3|nr:ATP-binding protein [Candidatus Absconditicoccus praedator]UFX82747.1 sensor histidine kinase [Candidatus Absconditicoccus praedator]
MDGNLDKILEILENDIYDINISKYFSKPSFLVGLISLSAENKVGISGFDALDYSKLNYLNRSGFLEILGKDCLNNNENDIATIHKLTLIDENIWEKAKDIDKLVVNILKNLKFDYSAFDNFYKSFNWIIRELLGNVDTHSQADFSKKGCVFMMQVYKEIGTLNFSISDNGIGFKESFRGSHYFDENKEDDYFIHLAMNKGITTSNEGKGNGLYGMKEILKATNSSMKILSGNYIYKLINGEEIGFEKINGYWKGVLLDIEFNMSNIGCETINNLIQRGVLKAPVSIDEMDDLDDLF